MNQTRRMWGAVLTKEHGFTSMRVPGRRSSCCIIRFSSPSKAWAFVKHASNNMETINAPKPLSGNPTVHPQRPFAQMEQTPEQTAHSSLVSKVVRCLHVMIEEGSIDSTYVIEPKYGKHDKGGFIVLKRNDYEEKVASIKAGEVDWHEGTLTTIGTSVEAAKCRFTSV